MLLIPDKLYFKIGEVAKIADLPPHVLRYWESEFPEIRPKRANSKQRLFRREDIETILTIKALLHQQGYTIAGARKLLASGEAVSRELERGTDDDSSQGDQITSQGNSTSIGLPSSPSVQKTTNSTHFSTLSASPQTDLSGTDSTCHTQQSKPASPKSETVLKLKTLKRDIRHLQELLQGKKDS